VKQAARAKTVAVVLVLSACNDSFRFDERDVPSNDGGSDASEARPCSQDADCPLPGLRCHVESGRCVACLGDGDCAAPTPRCEATLHVCVECLGSTDCGARQRCDATTSTCLATCAEGDEGCPANFVCDERAELCIECRTSAHCSGNPHGSRCDPATGRCVECAGHAQCPSERPRCDRRSGVCVGCVASVDCGPGEMCSPSTSACTTAP
jgi:Cys-rich repeat protein